MSRLGRCASGGCLRPFKGCGTRFPRGWSGARKEEQGCSTREGWRARRRDPTRCIRTHAGRAVYKPLTPAGITETDTHRVVFTTPVAVGDVDESVRLTAHLLQERIDKRYEVRLTVVDDVFLAARIDAGSNAAAVDWRADYEALAYAPLADVPSGVRAGVSALMGRLGLRFGTFDFIVTPDDRWVFLEINPNGQWAWIEDATGLPIAASIADALTRGNG